MTRPFGVPTVVSLNSIMVDGTGHVRVVPRDGGRKDEVRLRGRRRFRRPPGEFRRAVAAAEAFRAGRKGGDGAVPQRIGQAGVAGRARRSRTDGRRPPANCRSRWPRRRVRACRRTSRPSRRSGRRCRTSRPEERIHNFEEVALGLDLEGALVEADRCLRCKKPRCVPGCPVGIDIPGFIAALQLRDIKRVVPDSESIERAAGGVRAGLPAGIAMRSDLRGGGQVQAGGDRAAGAVRGGLRAWGAGGTKLRRRRRRRRGRRSSGRGRRAWPARETWRATA